jgi:hypothetical protein
MSDHDCDDPITFTDSDGVRVHVTCERSLLDRFGNPTRHKNHERHHDDIPGVSNAVTTWTRRP